MYFLDKVSWNIFHGYGIGFSNYIHIQPSGSLAGIRPVGTVYWVPVTVLGAHLWYLVIVTTFLRGLLASFY